MKNIIRKWLDMPTREELYERIDRQVLKRASKHYNKLRRSDRDRYKAYKALQDNNSRDSMLSNKEAN